MTDLTSDAAQPFEIGVFAFGELSPEPGGALSDPRGRLEQLLEWARVADQAGLDVFGVGEHHRPDFAVSSPQIVLAAAARETDSIRLTSTVSVLSSADPVRLFEEFATVDLLSGGRAEITAGRGAYVESFPLFGQDLGRYDEYFDDRLDLLLALRDRNPVTWQGTTRPPLNDAGVWPRPAQPELPVWLAVGGTPESAVRAGASACRCIWPSSGPPPGSGRSSSCTAPPPTPPASRSRGSASPRTSTWPRPPRPPVTRSTRTTPRTSPRTCHVAGCSTATPSTRGRARAVHCSPVAPRRSSTRSSGSTRCSATVASSPRWDSALDQTATLRSIELLATEVLPQVRRALAG